MAIDPVCGMQVDEKSAAATYDYQGKTWGNYGKKNQPSKWVTLRALRALKSTQMKAV